MWIPLSIFFVLWVLSIQFHMPVAVTFVFFTAILLLAGGALLEPKTRS